MIIVSNDWKTLNKNVPSWISAKGGVSRSSEIGSGQTVERSIPPKRSATRGRRRSRRGGPKRHERGKLPRRPSGLGRGELRFESGRQPTRRHQRR